MRKTMIFKKLSCLVLVLIFAIFTISCRATVTAKNDTTSLVQVLDEDGDVIETLKPGETKKFQVSDGYSYKIVPK